MPSERIQPWHPRREAIGAALSRAIPLESGGQGEEAAQRKMLRRIAIAEAVKRQADKGDGK